MDVKEFVRRAVSTHPKATTRMASEMMSVEETGALVVLEEGKLVGIISERDVVGRVVAKGLDPQKIVVSDVMTRDVRTVTEDIAVRRALEMMHQGRFRHLPVVNALGQVIGMVSIRQLMGERIGELTLKNDELLGFISADGPGG
jgi:CBS domain-containing protein